MVVKIFRFGIIFLTLIGIFIYIYFPSFSKLRELKEIEKGLDKELSLLEREIKNLKKDIELAEDPEYKKYFLRKKLNLLKEGEYILELKNSGVEQPGSSPGS